MSGDLWAVLLRTPALLIIPSAVDPPVRGEVGHVPVVKVERPAGRPTLTTGTWPTRLAQADGRRDDQLPPPPPSDSGLR
jgi:hypothetical protein